MEISKTWDILPEICSVSCLSKMIRKVFEDHFFPIWVCGELASLTKASSGHWYFVIKDSTAQFSCVMFRSASQKMLFKPQIGDQVEIHVVISFYQPRGDLQLTVDAMRKKGQGRFFEEFLRIKARLAAEGLFELQYKKNIPRYPRVIGVLTSSKAAALHDVLTTLKRRAPHIKIMHYDIPVQGHGAAEKIASKIEQATRDNLAEVLILCRGGGTIEDLSSFNDENLARVISNCAIPIITGIGHELDFTIADFVADLRAPTPTAAAELASPDRLLEIKRLIVTKTRIDEYVIRMINEKQQLLDWITRGFKNCFGSVPLMRSRVSTLQAQLKLSLKRSLQQRHQLFISLYSRLKLILIPSEKMRLSIQKLSHDMCHIADLLLVQRVEHIQLLKYRLDFLNPRQVLSRGYTFISLPDGGDVIRHAKQLKVDMKVKISFVDGSALGKIESIDAD